MLRSTRLPDMASSSSRSIHGITGNAVPDEQLAHMSTETRLLEKRRQALEAQELLERRKAEHESRERAFKEREDALRAKDLELQSSLTKFSRFLQDADARRARAVRKATEEHRAAVAAETQCLQAQQRLDALEHQQRTTHALLKIRMQCVCNSRSRYTSCIGIHMQAVWFDRHLMFKRRYQCYLETVADAFQQAGQQVELPDLLRRHHTLTANFQSLAAAQQAAQAHADQQRHEENTKQPMMVAVYRSDDKIMYPATLHLVCIRTQSLPQAHAPRF